MKLYKNFFNLLKIIITSNIKRCFYVENEKIFHYLKNRIYKSKKKAVIISSEKINFSGDNIIFLQFQNLFFLELAFLFLRYKYLYSSTPGLNSHLFRKSLFKNTKYIYLQHSNISLSMGYQHNAFIHFDYIQVVNKFQYKDFFDLRKVSNTKLKVFKSKYDYFNEIYIHNNYFTNRNLLIAPTWNTNFYDTGFFYDLIDILRHNKISFTLRPHPMSLKKNEINLNKIETMNLKIDKDTVPNFNKYNFLLSDWSGIFIEYIYLKKRKPIFFETQKKKLNKNYENFFKNKPAEEFLREKFGVIFNLNQLDEFINVLNGKDDYFDLSKKEAEIKNFFY